SLQAAQADRRHRRHHRRDEPIDRRARARPRHGARRAFCGVRRLRPRGARVALMLTRPIPSTGEAMPGIGLGTWRAFDGGSGEGARRPLREVLRLFLDAGGRIIDSSPMYGRAEAVTGDLLAEVSGQPRPFLATKVWTTGRERGVEQMRRSEQLLRTDVIDLM